jgi:hypothetical protein
LPTPLTSYNEYRRRIKIGSFSDFWELEILDHCFMKGSYTPPTNIFVALSTADPTDSGGSIAEPGSNYGRKSTVSADWTAASSGALDNANAITFAEATGSWGTITHFALFDHLTAGNMLAHGALSTPQTIESGGTASFAAGALDVSLD